PHAATLEIGAGAERRAGTGEDDDAYALVVECPAKTRKQAADQLVAQGVALLGLVEGNPSGIAPDFVEDSRSHLGTSNVRKMENREPGTENGEPVIWSEPPLRTPGVIWR